MAQIGGQGSVTNKLRGRLPAIQGKIGKVPPGWTHAQAQTAAIVMSVLQTAGATKAGAAAVVGNWFQESRLNPSSPGGYLGQWQGSRFSALITYAAQRGVAATNAQVQAEFAVQELSTQYPKLWAILKNTQDPAAAALAVSQQYERPNAALANNANRVFRARQAFGDITGGGAQGGVDTTGNYIDPTGGLGAGVGSILDIINAPVEAIGGWIASIALNLTKDIFVGIYDAVVVPFWHWDQRGVAAYTERMFGTQGKPSDWDMTIWTATFWGLGYWLLFTDPTQKDNFLKSPLKALKVGSAKKSRLARHTRYIQSTPARRRLKKPSEVEEATRAKPKPVLSSVQIRQVDTMQTHRPERVKVTSHGRRTDTARDTERNGRESHPPHSAKPSESPDHTPHHKPHKEH